MKVLNIQLKFTHGGNPQVCLDYSRVLKAAGNQVFVLTNPQDPFFEKHKEYADEVIPSKRLGQNGSYDILSIIYFKQVINRIKPDAIIVHEGRSAALFKRAAGKKVKVIDVNHGRSPKQSRIMDATIVTNSFQLERYKAFFGNKTRAYYLQNSMNLEGVELPKIPRNWHNPPVIGAIGRLVWDKAIDIFVEALSILDKKGVAFSAYIAGEGEERAALEKQIAEYNLKDKVKMPGWVKNPDEFYKQIDIFCFPSRNEEFGLVLLEAYKNGLPAVVSNAEGPQDIVENDKDGIIVPKENPEALANALQLLIENKPKADELAAAGFKKLQEKYDVPKVASLLQLILKEVVSQP